MGDEVREKGVSRDDYEFHPIKRLIEKCKLKLKLGVTSIVIVLNCRVLLENVV